MEALCVEIVSAFEARGIDCRVLKGPIIEQWLYADGTERPYHDIDVLVDPSKMEDAYEVLFALDFWPPAPAYTEANAQR
jgi:hypothetical protein